MPADFYSPAISVAADAVSSNKAPGCLRTLRRSIRESVSQNQIPRTSSSFSRTLIMLNGR